jgi:hypothetical protein
MGQKVGHGLLNGNRVSNNFLSSWIFINEVVPHACIGNFPIIRRWLFLEIGVGKIMKHASTTRKKEKNQSQGVQVTAATCHAIHKLSIIIHSEFDIHYDMLAHIRCGDLRKPHGQYIYDILCQQAELGRLRVTPSLNFPLAWRSILNRNRAHTPSFAIQSTYQCCQPLVSGWC